MTSWKSQSLHPVQIDNTEVTEKVATPVYHSHHSTQLMGTDGRWILTEAPNSEVSCKVYEAAFKRSNLLGIMKSSDKSIISKLDSVDKEIAIFDSDYPPRLTKAVQIGEIRRGGLFNDWNTSI